MLGSACMAKVAATSMNGERVIVIACGVGAILLCMTLIFIDLADLQDAWPVIAAVVLFVVFLSPLAPIIGYIMMFWSFRSTHVSFSDTA